MTVEDNDTKDADYDVKIEIKDESYSISTQLSFKDAIQKSLFILPNYLTELSVDAVFKMYALNIRKRIEKHEYPDPDETHSDYILVKFPAINLPPAHWKISRSRFTKKFTLPTTDGPQMRNLVTELLNEIDTLKNQPSSGVIYLYRRDFVNSGLIDDAIFETPMHFNELRDGTILEKVIAAGMSRPAKPRVNYNYNQKPPPQKPCYKPQMPKHPSADVFSFYSSFNVQIEAKKKIFDKQTLVFGGQSRHGSNLIGSNWGPTIFVGPYRFYISCKDNFSKFTVTDSGYLFVGTIINTLNFDFKSIKWEIFEKKRSIFGFSKKLKNAKSDLFLFTFTNYIEQQKRTEALHILYKMVIEGGVLYLQNEGYISPQETKIEKQQIVDWKNVHEITRPEKGCNNHASVAGIIMRINNLPLFFD